MSHELTVPRAPKLGTIELKDDEDDIPSYTESLDFQNDDYYMAGTSGYQSPQSNPQTPTPGKPSTLFEGDDGLRPGPWSSPGKRSYDLDKHATHRSHLGKIPKLDNQLPSRKSKGKGKERALYNLEDAVMSDDMLDQMGLSLTAAGFDSMQVDSNADEWEARDERFMPSANQYYPTYPAPPTYPVHHPTSYSYPSPSRTTYAYPDSPMQSEPSGYHRK